MATLKCRACDEPFGYYHKDDCTIWLNIRVSNEDCSTDQMVADSNVIAAIDSYGADYLINPDGSFECIEAEADQSSDQSELQLGLSDRLNFEDKL